jgi:hypothetical protein
MNPENEYPNVENLQDIIFDTENSRMIKDENILWCAMLDSPIIFGNEDIGDMDGL